MTEIVAAHLERVAKEPFNWNDWRVEYCEQSDPEIPNQHCQREKGHDGRHKSYSREWD